MELTLDERRCSGNVIVVHFSGRMVLGQEATAATDRLRALLSQNATVILDLNDLHHVDPSGIGALLSLYALAKRHGARLYFASPSSKIAHLLETTKLTSIFPVFASEEAAIAASASS